MKKNIMGLISALFLSVSLNAAKITETQCVELGDDFVFAGGECIETRTFEGDSNEHIMIIVHGTWPEGSNTLGRYAPFAETMNMNTDLTTIAVSLPGYSGSSTNKFEALAHKGVKNLSSNKEYIEFLSELVKTLKEKYEAKTVTYIGHSAAARMGATLSGIEPDLIQNIALAGGSYTTKEDGGISFNDYIDNASKDTKYLFIYGTEDKISKPEVTTSFYKIVVDKGLNAKLIEAKGAEHIDLDMTNASVDAIIKMVEEE